MPTSICPDCSEEVFVDADCEQGDTVTCDECASTLVVVGLDPIELDLKEDSGGEGSGDPDNYDFEDDGY